MSEILIPPWIIPESESHEWLDEGSSVFRAAFAPGLSQRQSYGGLRLKISRRHTVRAEEKAQLLSAIKATRGSYNAVRTKVHFGLRGSGFGSELVSNGTFANGTTGWTAGSYSALSVADRQLRVQRTTSGSADATARSAQITGLSAYFPYVARAYLQAGRGAYASNFNVAAGSTAGASDYANPSAATFGLLRAAFVIPATSVYLSISDFTSSGVEANDFFVTPFISLSRCCLVDNGVNNLLRSDAFEVGSTWTNSNCTVTANSTIAPDGTATGDTLVENNVNAQHILFQSSTVSSSAHDLVFSCAVAASSRGWVFLLMDEATGGHQARAWFNVSTGVVGSTATTGANWTNIRSYITNLGSGWYRCTMVARKTNAATSVERRIGASTGDTVLSYTGTTSLNAIILWRATSCASGSPTRLVSTSTTDTSGTSQTGTALHVKGLPVSSSGLLLPGDWVEINGELKHVTCSLNSDSAGLGYLQFEPALVRSPSDGDPVIISDPMGKFLVSNIKVDNEFGTQARVSYDLEHIYE